MTARASVSPLAGVRAHLAPDDVELDLEVAAEDAARTHAVRTPVDARAGTKPAAASLGVGRAEPQRDRRRETAWSRRTLPVAMLAASTRALAVHLAGSEAMVIVPSRTAQVPVTGPSPKAWVAVNRIRLRPVSIA
jgi:hypothetical protein